MDTFNSSVAAPLYEMEAYLRSQLARAISGHDQDGPALPSWWSGSGTTLRSSLLLLCLHARLNYVRPRGTTAPRLPRL